MLPDYYTGNCLAIIPTALIYLDTERAANSYYYSLSIIRNGLTTGGFLLFAKDVQNMSREEEIQYIIDLLIEAGAIYFPK